jgi:hypothetical protein
MDRAELLGRAWHYRALAARRTDGQTCQGLVDLAEKYEALARQVEKEFQGYPDDLSADI